MDPFETAKAAAAVRKRAGATPWSPHPAPAPRSLWLAYVLWWFAAPFAAHRFYLGAIRSAVVMLVLFWGGLVVGALFSTKSSHWVGGLAVPPLGVLMIMAWLLWTLVDAFLIPGLRRRAQNPPLDGLSEVFR